MINILISLSLTLLIVITGRYFFDFEPHGIIILGIYFLFYGIVLWLRSSVNTEKHTNDAHPDRAKWPIPGPLKFIGRKSGIVIFSAIFWITNLLSLINPLQLWQIMRQLIGNERLKNREKKFDTDLSNYQTKAKYCLPFRGEWLVYNGGITPETSHSWDILGQRYAIDFVQADEDFNRHSGNGIQLKDYYCYGREIISAASGTVVEIQNNYTSKKFRIRREMNG